MRRPRIVGRGLVACALLGSALALGACGGADDDGATQAATAADTTAASGAATGELTPITVALAPTTDYAALYQGIDDGTFEKHGLDVTVQQALTATANMAAVTAGKADLATNSAASGSTAIINGLPLKLVALTDILPTDGYVETLVRKDSGIKSYKDLAGKTVATINLQGLFELAIRNAVAKEGGDPKAVKTLAMSPADEPASLKAGRLDAIILQDPFLAQAKKDPDFVSLGNPFKLFDYPVLSGALFSSEDIISEKGDALKRFQAALAEASEKTQADPQLAREMIPTYTELTPDVVETIGLPEYTTKLPPQALTKLLTQMKDYGFVKEVPPEDELIFNNGGN